MGGDHKKSLGTCLMPPEQAIPHGLGINPGVKKNCIHCEIPQLLVPSLKKTRENQESTDLTSGDKYEVSGGRDMRNQIMIKSWARTQDSK